MSAHLWAVPDIPDEPEYLDTPAAPAPAGAPAAPAAFQITTLPPRQAAAPGGLGEYPQQPAAPAPAAAPTTPRDDDQDAGEHPDTDEPDPGAEDDEEWENEDDEEEDEEEPHGSGFPDLRPYADVRAAARLIRDYGPDGARLAWTGTKALGRWTSKILKGIGLRIRTATAHVAKILSPVWIPLCNWCAQAPGPRIGGGAAVVFFAGHPIHAPGVVRVASAIGWVLAVAATLALTGNGDAKKAAGKAKKPTGKKGKEAPAEVSKEAAPPPAQPPAETPEETHDEDQEELPFEDQEEVEEESPEDVAGNLPEGLGRPFVRAFPAPPAPPAEPAATPPAPPSRDAIARAFHHLYSGGSGVLLTALSKELSVPTTRALREHLSGAGIRVREGVRCPAGNGPGVHRDDAPPLPSSQEGGQGDEKQQVRGANNTAANYANNTEEGSREGFDAYSNRWTLEEIAQGFRLIPDRKGGHGWKVESYKGESGRSDVK
ncbi:hypothetical protein ACFWAP_03765 [Streptomyces goshikiensis]|uniref:hypothetical protein n=1 Tax=Streptomyces goshikiensis TaxID=1942 RepID=UPI0036488E7F